MDHGSKPVKSHPLKDKPITELIAMSESLKDRAGQLDEELRQLASKIQERRAIWKDRNGRHN